MDSFVTEREYSMAPPIFTLQVLISGMKGLGAEIGM